MKRTTASSSTPRTTNRTTSAPRVTKPRAPRATKAPATAAISESAIAMRAYEIFKARNGQPGDAVSDWLQAERELRTAN